MTEHSAARLRRMLKEGGIVPSLAVHDAFSARVVESAGVPLIFVGGFGAAASLLAVPDVGLMTLTEMADVVRHVAAAVSIPVVADGDTGHGDLHNVVRTVREFENAGAAGLLLEDQVAPKRCGHFSGKQVIAAGEMVLKLRAALEARRNPDFVIFARTDALAVEGLDAAIDRANRYGDAGADVCFVEAPASEEQLREIARQVRYPLLANMLVGGRTPILSLSELGKLGYRIAVCPVSTLAVAGHAMREAARAFLETGRFDGAAERMLSFDELKDLLRLPEIESLRQRLADS